MKNLVISFILFTSSVCSCEWLDIINNNLDINKECVFYDYWNDVIVYDKPVNHIYKMYLNNKVCVITHFIKLPCKPNVDVYLEDTLE